ncbi:hypothetical protein ANCDUO_00421 [Ancylostoma duodenale]|uniref:Uncharacterized protein n=1 Tax=Ancylostoma duodenale TaxID=51022 RepID=A0A0C2HHW5_9BILA|nr:hypothetical protein ANCDUO_00421 [Ancylostoma duodenale]
MGIIHGNFPKPEDQAAEVLKVKRFKQGFVMQPHCLKPDARFILISAAVIDRFY